MKTLLLATTLALLAAAPASANFIVSDTADVKIFFNSAKDVSAFTGNVAVNNTGDLVNFNSLGTVDVGNGFANITPTDTITAGNGDFTRLTITPTVQDWSAFTFRGQFGSLSATTNLTLQVTDQFNTTQTFAFNNLAGPNTDFADIGITSTDNERIKSLTIQAGSGDNFKELKQFEVLQSGTQECVGPDCPVITPVNNAPEPMSAVLLGTALLGLGTIRLTRRS